MAVEVAVASRGIEVLTGDLLESFLAKYLPQILEFGYEKAPFEVDAREAALPFA